MDWLKDYFAPVVSLIFSSFAFLFTLKNEYSKKFNIEVEFLDRKISEQLVDRDSATIPDVYFQDKFRLLPMICITNNSSYPVTVTELKLNGEHIFSFFTQVGDSYEITFESATKRIDEGVLATGGNTRIRHIDNVDQYLLKPPFTIEPFQSSTGLIFFTYDSSLLGKNTISFKTSRGTKEFEIEVVSQYVSKKISDYIPPRLD